MNILSLFDGLSGGRIALDRANIKVDNYYASEIDKFAIQVSKNNYEDVQHIGSVLNVDVSKLESIDLLIGGSPCQSFSRAGDGSGFDGKSKLFWEYIRILNDIRKYNPNVKFLLENVVMKKEWENLISETLGVKPILIDSKLISAQKRQRLYWTNISDNIEQPLDKNINLIDFITENEKREIINDHGVVLEKYDNSIKIKNGTKLGYLIAYHGDSVNLEFPKSEARRGRVGIGKTNTLNTACNYGVFFNGNLLRLNINDYEQLQTLPINYTNCVSEYQRRKMIGNGWTIDVIVHILSYLNKDN